MSKTAAPGPTEQLYRLVFRLHIQPLLDQGYTLEQIREAFNSVLQSPPGAYQGGSTGAEGENPPGKSK